MDFYPAIFVIFWIFNGEVFKINRVIPIIYFSVQVCFCASVAMTTFLLLSNLGKTK